MDLGGNHRLKDTLPPFWPPSAVVGPAPLASACVSVSCLHFAVRGRQTDRSRRGSACPLHCLSPLCAPSPPACLPCPTLDTSSMLPLLSLKVTSPSLRLGQLYVSSSCHLPHRPPVVAPADRGAPSGERKWLPPGLRAPCSHGWKSHGGTAPFCVSATHSHTQASFLSSDPRSHTWGDLWLWTRMHAPPKCAHTEHATSALPSLLPLSPFPVAPPCPGTRADSCWPSPGPLSQPVFRSCCLWCVSSVWFVHRSKHTAFMWPPAEAPWWTEQLSERQGPEASCPGPGLPGSMWRVTPAPRSVHLPRGAPSARFCCWKHIQARGAWCLYHSHPISSLRTNTRPSLPAAWSTDQCGQGGAQWRRGQREARTENTDAQNASSLPTQVSDSKSTAA